MGHMSNQGSPEHEGSPERIPSREEVLVEIRKRCQEAEVFNELSDEEGIYVLEARMAGEASGEFTDYVYQRKGVFPGGYGAASTVLERIDCVDGEPCGGEIVAEYNSATGEWTEA